MANSQIQRTREDLAVSRGEKQDGRAFLVSRPIKLSDDSSVIHQHKEET